MGLSAISANLCSPNDQGLYLCRGIHGSQWTFTISSWLKPKAEQSVCKYEIKVRCWARTRRRVYKVNRTFGRYLGQLDDPLKQSVRKVDINSAIFGVQGRSVSTWNDWLAVEEMTCWIRAGGSWPDWTPKSCSAWSFHFRKYVRFWIHCRIWLWVSTRNHQLWPLRCHCSKTRFLASWPSRSASFMLCLNAIETRRMLLIVGVLNSVLGFAPLL